MTKVLRNDGPSRAVWLRDFWLRASLLAKHFVHVTTHIPLSSSFLGLPYRILKTKTHKKGTTSGPMGSHGTPLYKPLTPDHETLKTLNPKPVGT